MEKLIPRVAHARYILIPISDSTRGHGSHSRPALWHQYLEEFLQQLPPIDYGKAGARSPEGELLLDPSDPEWRKPAPPASHLTFRTTQGTFVLELIRSWGPIGADRLYNLARLGYFDDTRVHRVRRGYIVQFGINGDSAVNAAWADQQMRDDPPRSHNKRGTFAFSYAGPGRPNTRNTQIYINLGDNSRNDSEPFTVLGRVAEGMAVLDSMYSGYGEKSGSGVRQGKQTPLLQGGNAYMDREFPKLDRILSVKVEAAGSSGAEHSAVKK
jgi:homoserine O-acetyltransferase